MRAVWLKYSISICTYLRSERTVENVQSVTGRGVLIPGFVDVAQVKALVNDAFCEIAHTSEL